MKPDKKRTKKQNARHAGQKGRRENHKDHRGQPKGGPHKGGHLPPILTLIVSRINGEGEAVAVPELWEARKEPPVIILRESKAHPATTIGQRVMAELTRAGKHHYTATIIRILPAEPPKTVVGLFAARPGGGVIEPVSRKVREVYAVGQEDTKNARNGELVKGALVAGSYFHGLPRARIEECLGDARAPKAASLIAAHLNNLPMEFSEATLAEAEKAKPPVLMPGLEDLRGLPLVTIDGEDARDFDDAVFAEPDSTRENPGGFHIIVAIADVSHYVAEGSALDADAFTRGNSAYFPDRVIPMLPERLSNGLCSLKPEEDRYCIAVHLWIDAHGIARRYRFTRGLMRSHARLTYTQVENAGSITDPQTQQLVAHLNAAYAALARERDQRGTLAINLPEYKVQFDAEGHVAAIARKPSLESHRLIESFMVAANVAAADYMLGHRAAGIYRVHEPPTEEKLEELRRFLGLSGYSFPKGAVTPGHLNQVLHKAERAPNAAMIHTAVLRSQMQANYGEKNLGHFGLALTQYCHFTSPIRRYSDLVVHRSIAALLENRPYKPENLKDIAQHISATERNAMMAERDAMDRYKISYLSRLPENVFEGSITSLNEHGLFVSLRGTGITGFVPVTQLGQDFFLYEPRMARMKGRGTGRIYKLGDPITVRVLEADPLKGSLIFRPEQQGKKHPRQEEAGKKKHYKKKPGKKLRPPAA